MAEVRYRQLEQTSILSAKVVRDKRKTKIRRNHAGVSLRVAKGEPEEYIKQIRASEYWRLLVLSENFKRERATIASPPDLIFPPKHHETISNEA